jgi:hypothetical protein
MLYQESVRYFGIYIAIVDLSSFGGSRSIEDGVQLTRWRSFRRSVSAQASLNDGGVRDDRLDQARAGGLSSSVGSIKVALDSHIEIICFIVFVSSLI